MKLEIRRYSIMEYHEALKLQQELHARRLREDIPDTLILLQHFPVITLGKRGSGADLLRNKGELEADGVEVVNIGRGGEATYHGPGQLVGYLIINLYNHNRKIRQFVWNLEEVIIRFLDREYSIQAERDPKHPGVWTGTEKIAALGIEIRNSVTMHGFALNINTNLEHFKWIVPCGITDRGVTSIEKLSGEKQDIRAIEEKISRYFCEVYGYDLPLGAAEQ